MTSAQLTLLLSAIGSSSVVIPGQIILYGSTTIPTGYLPCDGAAVSRTTYNNLFAVCGSSFGAGDGVTTFNVPDLRCRLPMGVGAGPGLSARAIGAQGGAEGTVVAQANLAAFALPVTDPGHVHTVGSGEGNYVDGGGNTEYLSTGANKGNIVPTTDSAVTGVTVATGGGATALPTIDPFTAVAYFIKT